MKRLALAVALAALAGAAGAADKSYQVTGPGVGVRPDAIVVPKEGETLTEAEIVDHARGLIAGYKVPKSVAFRTEPLPLSGAMKVLKRELRAPYWEGRDRAVN